MKGVWSSTALPQPPGVDRISLASSLDPVKWQSKQLARSKHGSHCNKSQHGASGSGTPGIGQSHVSRVLYCNVIGEDPEWVGQFAQSALRRRDGRFSIGQRAVRRRPIRCGADLAPSLSRGGPRLSCFCLPAALSLPPCSSRTAAGSSTT